MSEKNPFAGDVKPSMQRRSQWADYRGRRMYMVTMVIEGRRPLLGEVVGDIATPPEAVEPPATDVRPRPPREAYDREHGLLFASGYNDRLLLRAGQLERWLHYLADNPRRLLMKRQYPDWLRPHFHVNVGGNTFSAIANR